MNIRNIRPDGKKKYCDKCNGKIDYENDGMCRCAYSAINKNKMWKKQ
jgi:hypothetical protein